MTFIDLLIDGVLIQGILALGIVGTWLYLLATAGEAPDALSTAAMLVLGVFFGTVVEKTRARVRGK